MYRTVLCMARGNHAKSEKIVKRHMSYNGIKKYVRNYLKPRSVLPYSHVCQVGDPVMRAQALPVDMETIPTPEFQRLIERMTAVLREYNAMGLSANQIGLPYQIFLMEVTKNHLKHFKESYKKSRLMELVPLKVFINPKMKVIDHASIKHTEECISILGYSAVVPRAKSIQIEAINTSGQPFIWNADGWSARIAQHEMDHLSGKLFVDRMDPSTFECTWWSMINKKRGNVAIRYKPQSWFQRIFLNE